MYNTCEQRHLRMRKKIERGKNRTGKDRTRKEEKTTNEPLPNTLHCCIIQYITTISLHFA
jgi:hypothetical protein